MGISSLPVVAIILFLARSRSILHAAVLSSQQTLASTGVPPWHKKRTIAPPSAYSIIPNLLLPTASDLRYKCTIILYLVLYINLNRYFPTTISCQNCGTFSKVKRRIVKLFHVENQNLDKNVSRETYILWLNYYLPHVSCETF